MSDFASLLAFGEHIARHHNPSPKEEGNVSIARKSRETADVSEKLHGSSRDIDNAYLSHTP